MANKNDKRQYKFENFGEALRYLRSRYYAEVNPLLPAGAPVTPITALTLIGLLGEHGYSISSGSYSALEANASLPRDPNRFLEALSKSLPLPGNAELWRAIERQLAIDVLARQMGPRRASDLILGN